MWNYAYLTAKQKEISKLYKSPLSVEFKSEEGQLLYTIDDVQHSYDLNIGISQEELLCIQNVSNYSEDIKLLLNLPSHSITSFESSALFFLLEKEISRYIKGHTYRGKRVSYTYKGQVKVIEIEKEGEEYKEERLICAEFIKRGGRIEEVPGKFFRLKSLSQTIPTVTSTSVCSCEQYEGYQRCFHLEMVKHIIRSRNLFPSI